MKILIVACLCLITCAARIACALPLDEYPGTSDALELHVAGSSAQDNTLQRLFRILCEPNSLDVYHTGNGEMRLFFCRGRSGAGSMPGLAPGQKIAFHKSSVGGSGSGVGPLIQLTPVQFLNVADLRAHLDERCPVVNRKRRAAEGSLTGYTDYDCVNPTPTLEVPDAGISDVEPRFFLNSFRLAPDAIDILSVHNSHAFIFGIPVSLGLRDAMQAARFPSGSSCNPANPHYADLVVNEDGVSVPSGESEPCMPSLSRAQIAGIFSGVLSNWSQVLTPSGYPLAERASNDAPVRAPMGVRPPSDDHVFVCRRVNTSGTQAAYEMFFLNGRCTAGIPPFVESGDNVFVGSVTSDVKACLTSLDQRGVWAVGIMSTENVESIRQDRWRFVKMDGVAPTLMNTFKGRWPFFVEQSYQWRGEHSDKPLQGSKLAVMAYLGRELADPSIVRDLDAGFRHAWGSSGLMAIGDENLVRPPRPVPGKPVTVAMVEKLPILAVRHASNNCSAVVAEYPTELP